MCSVSMSKYTCNVLIVHVFFFFFFERVNCLCLQTYVFDATYLENGNVVGWNTSRAKILSIIIIFRTHIQFNVVSHPRTLNVRHWLLDTTLLSTAWIGKRLKNDSFLTFLTVTIFIYFLKYNGHDIYLTNWNWSI